MWSWSIAQTEDTTTWYPKQQFFLMVVSNGWFQIFTWEMVGNHQTSPSPNGLVVILVEPSSKSEIPNPNPIQNPKFKLLDFGLWIWGRLVAIFLCKGHEGFEWFWISGLRLINYLLLRRLYGYKRRYGNFKPLVGTPANWIARCHMQALAMWPPVCCHTFKKWP